MGQPLVFPHGVTVYNPEKCWSGYTIVPLINDGFLLFEMRSDAGICMPCRRNFFRAGM